MKEKCNARTEVYSRVCGFYRPVAQWNRGKKAEFDERKEFIIRPLADQPLTEEGEELTVTTHN
jgi:ribonucleoside-triphosphate reductase